MPIGSRKWIWMTLLATLVLGMSLGVVLDELVLGSRGEREERNRPARPARFKAMLESELDLSPEQTESLDKVLAANNEKARRFWSDTRSAYAELRQQFRQEIRALLTPEQQERFDEMMVKHERRHQGEPKER